MSEHNTSLGSRGVGRDLPGSPCYREATLVARGGYSYFPGAVDADLYLTTHNTHNRQTSMSPVGFEPTISAGERPLGPSWKPLRERRQPPNTQYFDLTPICALLFHTLHSLLLYSEPPLTCHPSSYWLRLFSSQTFPCNRKVAGSIPAGVSGNFHWYKILPIALWPWGRFSL